MKKILMATNGMEIGGAETHILELATELTRMGYDVTVASNGGVYVQELLKSGIKHVKIPLNSHSIFKVFKAFFALKKLIKKEKFDLVHAHARIPAFLCGLIHRRGDFRFITTAHWVFEVTGILRILSNWGERTIAVSDDIKKYLIDNYGESADKISVTINGIDTQKFSPETDISKIEKELDLDKHCKKIVYVSRMDTDRSAVAFMLADIACKIEESVQLVIVGGGNDLTRLQDKASEVNNAMGRKAVVVAGQRVDINKCVALADIFVGVSRAALEAMSSEKPVIIAGNEGYIGIFSQDTYDISLKTNFCCRGCPESTPELLLSDINRLFKSDILSIGKYNRQMIQGNYSVKRMTMDCVTQYNKLFDHPVKGIIISGYYGYKNIGDDALLSVILRNIRSECPDADITVLSKTPEETCSFHNVKSIQRFNFWGIMRAMKKCRLLISGGGSLFQDITSTHSLIYYTAIIGLAARMGLKIMVYANGIGPLGHEKNKKRTIKAINKSDIITLRDRDSYKELISMGIPKERLEVTADPAFALEGVSKEQLGKIYKNEGLKEGEKYFAVSVREWAHVCEGFEDKIAQVCRYTADKYGIKPLFIPMQQSKDSEISMRICKLIGTDARCISGKYSVEETLSLMGEMELVMGMRLHTIIYALSQYVPVIGLSYDPKVDAMITGVGNSYCVKVDCFESKQIMDAVDSIVSSKQEIHMHLEQAVGELKQKTYADTQKAIALYRGNSI